MTRTATPIASAISPFAAKVAAILAVLVVVAVVVVVVVVGGGCAAAQSLTVPDANAPLAERAEAYERLRPQAWRTARVGVLGQRGRPDLLLLSDGTTVTSAVALEPLVAPSSDTTLHAERAVDDSFAEAWAFGIGGPLAVGGSLVVVGTLMTSDGGQHLDVGQSAALVGAIGACTLGLAGVIAGSFAGAAATGETIEAYNAYDRDLRARLGLVPRRDKLAARWENQP